ncbi:M56 family metallopeptidase [Rhodococcus sp. 14C212]|uniref:M56 family metallopeptidase n=1 Tax=Rhodococcus sp. 14C212 TaxID=2711209 RepID=UPI003211E15D
MVWLRENSCAAYSIGGRNGAVVASEGLSVLAPRERHAVLAHEYAHIRGRHHVLVMFGAALAAALPFVPLCRQGAIWVRVLVELAADRRAAQACGHDAVRDALIRCSAQGARSSAPEPSSHRFVDDRLRWLGRAPRPGRSRRVLAYPLALTVSALPALLAGVSVMGIVAASCLTV